LEENYLFLNPQLDYVRLAAQPASATELYQFSIKVILRSPKSEDEEDDADDSGGLR
jgi:hypothetical protein